MMVSQKLRYAFEELKNTDVLERIFEIKKEDIENPYIPNENSLNREIKIKSIVDFKELVGDISPFILSKRFMNTDNILSIFIRLFYNYDKSKILRIPEETKRKIIFSKTQHFKKMITEYRGFLLHKDVFFENDYQKVRLAYLINNEKEPQIFSEEIFEHILVGLENMFISASEYHLMVDSPNEKRIGISQKNSYEILCEFYAHTCLKVDFIYPYKSKMLAEYYLDKFTRSQLSDDEKDKLKKLKYCPFSSDEAFKDVKVKIGSVDSIGTWENQRKMELVIGFYENWSELQTFMPQKKLDVMLTKGMNIAKIVKEEIKRNDLEYEKLLPVDELTNVTMVLTLLNKIMRQV